MTRNQFEKEVTRLTEEWRSAYGPQRLLRLFKKFGHLDAQLFSEVIDHILDSYRSPPTISDVQKAWTK